MSAPLSRHRNFAAKLSGAPTGYVNGQMTYGPNYTGTKAVCPFHGPNCDRWD